MKRPAFLLGLYSVGGQVLLLRELISSFNGDELFIGIALFGWLIAVAVGAFLGGKSITSDYRMIFIVGVIVLPLMIVTIRLSPLLVCDVAGEVIPFTTAALFSIILMVPVGMVSGLLFPIIANVELRAGRAIVKVYLFEGIGAFVGGLVITLLAGDLLSTLTIAFLFGIVIIAAAFISFGLRSLLLAAGSLLGIAALIVFIPYLDYFLESIKHPSYQVEATFDTQYSHQALLSRDSSYLLITDNVIEASYPNLESAENLLIPPLLYKPEAKSILFLGRAEFGVSQLADSFPDLDLTAVDPRDNLGELLDRHLPTSATMRRINDDPVGFFSHTIQTEKYDIIIVNAGEPDNYKSGRLLTKRFLDAVKLHLKPGGLVAYPARYDTERYISSATVKLISIINNVFKNSFADVKIWPGNTTLFLASDNIGLFAPNDTIVNRAASLVYTPRYLNDLFLQDRLQPFRMERLLAALDDNAGVNSIRRPILPHFQAAWRAKASELEQASIIYILQKPLWILVVPILLFIFFLWAVTGRNRNARFGLFLFLVAGLISLSLELISFYLYQSSVGSLYSELAVLVGAFMAGLALGTYYSHKVRRKGIEYPALLLMIASTLLLLFTYDSILPQAMYLYHLLFLFTVAIATGALFVSATNRFYSSRDAINRGSGYACELVGSALGALVCTTVLLPMMGINLLLISILAIAILALLGSLITGSGSI